MRKAYRESHTHIPSPAARRPRPRLEYDSSATGSPAGRSGIEPAPLHRLAAAGSPHRAASPSAALAAVVAHTCGRGRASGRGLTAALWVRAGPVRAGKSGAVCALRRVRARGGAWGGGGAHLAWAARLEPPGPAKGPCDGPEPTARSDRGYAVRGTALSGAAPSYRPQALRRIAVQLHTGSAVTGARSASCGCGAGRGGARARAAHCFLRAPTLAGEVASAARR